jgi:hypothetical protein
LRFGIRKVLPDVAKTSGAKQGVGYSMRNDVGVAVPDKRTLARERDTT